MVVSGGREGGLLLLLLSSDGEEEEEKEEEKEKRERSVKDTTSHTADSYPNAAPPRPLGVGTQCGGRGRETKHGTDEEGWQGDTS